MRSAARRTPSAARHAAAAACASYSRLRRPVRARSEQPASARRQPDGPGGDQRDPPARRPGDPVSRREFHVSVDARARYNLDETLFELSGNVILANLRAVRGQAADGAKVREDHVSRELEECLVQVVAGACVHGDVEFAAAHGVTRTPCRRISLIAAWAVGLPTGTGRVARTSRALASSAANTRHTPRLPHDASPMAFGVPRFAWIIPLAFASIRPCPVQRSPLREPWRGPRGPAHRCRTIGWPSEPRIGTDGADERYPSRAEPRRARYRRGDMRIRPRPVALARWLAVPGLLLA